MTVFSLCRPLCLLVALCAATAPVAAGVELYFSFSYKPDETPPAAPSSLIVPSPTFIDVPAGATLSVHLLRGDTVVSTSRLSFSQAVSTSFLFPAVPFASFVPPGSSTEPGVPVVGASLTPGTADLNAVVAAPTQYRLLWVLTAGITGTPGSVTITGAPVRFLDLRLSAVHAAGLVGDQKPGSVLFFNRYTSSASNPSRENTVINLTNSNPTTSVFVRMFLVGGATCQPETITICLAAQQTAGLRMSDIDPGTKGYIVAVACDAQGRPVNHNWLIGNATIKQSAAAGVISSVLAAVAAARRKDGPVVPSGGAAELAFDDVNYDRLPGQLAFDSVSSQMNGQNATQLSLYRPLTDLAGGTSSAAVQITGWGRDQQGNVVASTGSVSLACYAEVGVASLRLAPTVINNLIPTDATGWLAASTTDLLPLLGTQLNAGEFNGGSNARPLSFSNEFKIRLPVTALACQ